MPWLTTPGDATGTLSVVGKAAGLVHLFVHRSSGWELVGPETPLTATELRRGVELGLEGRDIVRDSVVEQQANASGAPLRRLDQSGDSWTQDIFEPAYMS